MRVTILCNHTLGLPAIQELSKAKLLVGVATSNTTPSFLKRLKPILKQFQIPLITLTKTQLHKKLAAFLKNKKAEVVFVLTFKYKIPAKLLTIPKWGFINFHPGPLPQYRGPDPVFWQIKNQIPQCSLTMHHMDASFDTGPIISSIQVPLSPDFTYGQFMSEAGFVALQMMGNILQLLGQTGMLPKIQQVESKANYLKRPTHSEMQINWQTQDSSAIKALVNACNPAYGGAITFFRNQPLQILQVTPLADKTTEKSGKIVHVDAPKGFLVACADGLLMRIDVVQTGEGFMTGERFVAMANVKEGTFFE